MVKSVDNGAANAAIAVPPYASHDLATVQSAAGVAELVAAALARLRRDLDMYHPNQPAIAYALAGETHAATLQQWRKHPPAAQIALLAALLDEASGLLRQLHARGARIGQTNGYMYGLQDEAIRLEAQADITLEEIRRIEADLGRLKAQPALQ